MKHAVSVSCLVLSGLSLAVACSSQGGDGNGQEEDAGSVELALSSVPSDVACLRVSVSGSRNASELFSLTAGVVPSLTMSKLPLGIVQLDAQAFATSCSSVTGASVPNYVSEAVLPVRVDPLKVVQVVLKLVRNGRVGVSVDFEAPPWVASTRAPVDLAIVGDTPYGAVQIADFPKFIADINAAPGISEIVHLGDIKNGSSRCDTSYFQFIFDNFALSNLPFIYTPGDNEWTDCHRANNGAYDPLERLSTIRSMFYPVPGLSLGVNKRQVLSQSSIAGFETFVENQLWFEAGTVFSALHVVGSNNSLLPWYTDDTTGTKLDDPTRRVAEEEARTVANLDWLERSFAMAKEQNAAGVVLLMQADMWDGTGLVGFDSTVQKIAALTLSFGKPVLLLEGDSHIYKQDNPLANGDATHGVTTPVPNITRVVVQGSTTTPLTEWLRLHVDPAATPPFTWTRNPR
ncbi:MAG: metallophosphoesterase [Polyangiaceae bacterium]